MATESERKRITPFNLETLIDQQIREAMERGDFDNLRGAGKPQNLARDPNVPEDWELAFQLLKNAGFAPEWIEMRKEVDATREKIFAPMKRFLENPPTSLQERERTREKTVQEFRTNANELNRSIDIYNLKAPTMNVHLRKIRVEYEIDEFLKKAGK